MGSWRVGLVLVYCYKMDDYAVRFVGQSSVDARGPTLVHGIVC